MESLDDPGLMLIPLAALVYGVAYLARSAGFFAAKDGPLKFTYAVASLPVIYFTVHWIDAVEAGEEITTMKVMGNLAAMGLTYFVCALFVVFFAAAGMGKAESHMRDKRQT